MKKFIFFTLMMMLAFVSCGDNTSPETGSKMKVSVTAGQATDTELTFTVTSENCINCSWLCVKKGTSVPSDTDIMTKGKSVFVNQEASAKASNLDDNTTYVIIAAAMDENGNIITSTPVEMTTLEREAQPAVALSAGAAEADTYTFTLTPTDAEICYYKVYPDGATSSADDIVATGIEVSGTESQSITIEDLEDGIYFILAVAKNGDVVSELSNKITFTIDTALPTFTPTITKVWVNPSLETNGHDFMVRFYFADPAGDTVTVSLNFDTIENGHDYLPAGNYVFGATSGYTLVPEYTSYDNWWEFTEGYCNVSIKDKKYTFDIYLVRADDDMYYAGQAFVLNWTGTVENMPIP